MGRTSESRTSRKPPPMSSFLFLTGAYLSRVLHLFSSWNTAAVEGNHCVISPSVNQALPTERWRYMRVAQSQPIPKNCQCTSFFFPPSYSSSMVFFLFKSAAGRITGARNRRHSKTVGTSSSTHLPQPRRPPPLLHRCCYVCVCVFLYGSYVARTRKTHRRRR